MRSIAARIVPRSRSKCVLVFAAVLGIALSGGPGQFDPLLGRARADVPVENIQFDNPVLQHLARSTARSVNVCDPSQARNGIDSLKGHREGARTNPDPEGRISVADLLKLDDLIDLLEREFAARCGRHHLSVSPRAYSASYAFHVQTTRDRVAKPQLDRALHAAEDCNEAEYDAAVAELERVARIAADAAAKNPQFRVAYEEDARSLRRIARDLRRLKRYLFKHCDKEGPKPSFTEPAQTPGTPTPATPPDRRTGFVPPAQGPFAPAMPAAFGSNLPGFEIMVSLGLRNNSADGSYQADGGQPPGSGTGDKSRTNFCGNVTGYIPLPIFDQYLLQHDPSGRTSALVVLGAAQLGGRFGVCHLGGGDKVVLDLVRHGADGRVSLTETERAMISLLFIYRQILWINTGFAGRRAAAPAPAYAALPGALPHRLAQAAPASATGSYWPVVLYAGAGPSFVSTKVEMTSNQVPGGGVFESTRERRWDTGWSFVLGAQTAVCRDCVFGNPAMLGVEGQWTSLPSRGVSVTSSTFGFVESGRVSSRNSSRVMFTVTVPFTIGR